MSIWLKLALLSVVMIFLSKTLIRWISDSFMMEEKIAMHFFNKIPDRFSVILVLLGCVYVLSILSTVIFAILTIIYI